MKTENKNDRILKTIHLKLEKSVQMARNIAAFVGTPC
jgi:hypothetical protein